MENLHAAGMRGFKISVVCTRHNVDQLDAFKALADRFGAQLRLTRLRPSGRGADVWDELHLLPGQQRQLYDWLVEHGEGVLTGDSFFHLAAYGVGAARAQPVRGRPGGLPDRPGRRRVRLPVRHPRELPRRQRPRAGRVRRCVADLGAVPLAAAATVRGRVRVLRRLRRLPRRVHGGEVLHRAAAGRPRPGVRGRARRHRSVHCGPAWCAATEPATTRMPAASGAAPSPSPSDAAARRHTPVTRTRWPGSAECRHSQHSAESTVDLAGNEAVAGR